jgi:hypothetical protein
MTRTVSHAVRKSFTIVGAAALFAACTGETTVAPDGQIATPARVATEQSSETEVAIATLQRVTARYHDLNVAIADSFVLLHPCENRPDEGPVGIVYVNMGRLLDGVVNAESPDALIYEPATPRPKLVGVEFAVVNAGQAAPQFLGNTFQEEDEFGVFALHAWVWRNNPEGLFAETNPNVFCGAE